ncbi:ribokinase [Clostridiaceae bacterium AM27-36LB]|nr:ribokinase [Clostridiales bacterium AM23-16LB]RHR44957.1 ribokinase [Clostridiaceae bacterium AF18-31LB]RHT82589.1 ribokinase [Clostridiaceae bacterium AM27-36LB]RHW04784.1 ribokinase [Clostridiaceae bacterium OF09-1]
MKVLCFGSLNIDYTYKVPHFVKKGETLASERLQVFGGGKGLNQSVALAKAGTEVYHAGSIGQDGRFLLDMLKDAGANTDFVKILDTVRTGNAIIQNDKSGDNCIILYGGANQAITREQVDEVMSHFESGDYLVLQNEINELGYIVEKAHEKGMIIVLNPSPMNEKILALPLDVINYFILNEVEAAQILGKEDKGEESWEQIADDLLKKFPQATIVLTMGSEGSVFKNQKETVCQSIYKVQAVDTTAAGDTFSGYFIGGILGGLSAKEAMDQASKASAIAVTRKGAAPSIPVLAEVQNYK